jgi:hypothetical protein
MSKPDSKVHYLSIFDIDKSSISGHYDIEVKLRCRSFCDRTASISKPQNFDIDVSQNLYRQYPLNIEGTEL